MKNTLIYLFLVVFAVACIPTDKKSGNSFESQLDDYFQKFPYQETYNYMKMYTQGDATKLNKWLLPMVPKLLKAGEDVIVRSNNDTYYNMAFMELSQGPVKLTSANFSEERFYSFQLMDDRNTNFNNIINPHGDYYIYYGDVPENLDGELIKAPSVLTVVVARVELKNQHDSIDVKNASEV